MSEIKQIFYFLDPYFLFVLVLVCKLTEIILNPVEQIMNSI